MARERMLAAPYVSCNSGSVKSPRTKTQSARSGSGTDPGAIDELYGLEPVFEPGSERDSTGSEDSRAASGPERIHWVQCPYCGERFETLLDLSAGSASYIEDCQVCCQPIDFRLQVDQDGGLVKLEALRAD
jgi:hypothetical protein